MSVVDEVKARLDIVDVISEYVPLKKAGRNFKALCPFHTEKTPSFVVFPDGQNWHCFGACSTGGDVFSFVMRAENLDFSETLQLLARKAGVELRPRTDEEAAEDEHQQRLRQIVGAAAQYFHNLLLNSPAAEGAREYLVRRRIAPETTEVFQLGFALDSWDALRNYLSNKGYSLDDICAAGLIIEREGGGGYYDRFRGRLMIPIRDERGRTIGFGGRVLGDGVPKYLNSPQTAIFDKGHIFFGLDMAKQAIRREGTAVITEGYMDVLTAHQNGFKNVIASLGTALTEKQVRLLKRFTRQFRLSMDADAAGRAATLRGLDVVKGAADQQVVPVPTWRGLISYESQLDADISIIALPKGQDPDEVIRQSKGLWERLVTDAVPIVDYYFAALTSDLDMGSPKDKAKAVRRLMPIIEEIINPIERTHYLQKLARLVRVDEEVLLDQVKPRRPRAKRQGRWSSPTPPPAMQTQEPAPALEEYLLWFVMQEPWLLWAVQNLLVQTGIGELDTHDFENAENREIFTALSDRIGQRGKTFDPGDFQVDLDETLGAKVGWLLKKEASAPPIAANDLAQEAVYCFLRLRQRSLRRQLHDLRFVLEEAQQEGDTATVVHYGSMVTRLTEAMKKVQQALRDRATVAKALREAGTETVVATRTV